MLPYARKNKATKKEKGKSSGSNIKKCPVKNRKQIPGTEIEKEDRCVVDPNTIDDKKAILDFGEHSSMKYQQPLTKNPGYANYVLSVTDSKGALGTLRQWLLMQPDVVCANEISPESLSAR